MASPVQLGPFLRGKAGPPIVIPGGLPNLELYLDAVTDFSGTPNGTAVSAWQDLTVNNRDATQAVAGQQPSVVNPGAPNGAPWVQFTAADVSPPGRFLGGLIPLGTWPTDVRGYTMYAVGDWVVPANTFQLGIVFDSSGSLGGHEVGNTKGTGYGAPNTRVYGRYDGLVKSFQAFAAGARVYTWVCRPPEGSGAVEVWENGSQQAQSGGTATWTINRTILANYGLCGAPDNTNTNGCRLGSFLWYSDAHTPAVIGHITRYLRRRYGV